MKKNTSPDLGEFVLVHGVCMCWKDKQEYEMHTQNILSFMVFPPTVGIFILMKADLI